MSAGESSLLEPLIDEDDLEQGIIETEVEPAEDPASLTMAVSARNAVCVTDEPSPASTSHSHADADEDSAKAPLLARVVGSLQRGPLWRAFVESEAGWPYLALCIWFAAITVTYLFTRLLAIEGFPPDGEPQWDSARAFADLVGLYMLTFFVQWMVNGLAKDRVYHFFVTCWWAPCVMLAVSPLFTAVTLWRPLQQSLGTIAVWGPIMWVFTILILALVAYAIWHHVTHALRRLPPDERAVYFATRLGLVAFMGIGITAVALLEGAGVHLHHWFTMQLAGTMAAFKTRRSVATLAVCMGMMSHGIAAYGYGGMASLFNYPAPNCSFFEVRDADVFRNMTVTVQPPSVRPRGGVIGLVSCAVPRTVNATQIITWHGPRRDYYYDAMDDGYNPPRPDF